MRIIAGEAKGRRLVSPPDRSTRPPLDRIRESVFSLLEGCFEGREVLDLFAGTGSLGLEALSRGARRVVFVENAAPSISVLQRNIELVGFSGRAEVLRGNALARPNITEIEEPQFSLVFLDPPFPLLREPGAAKPVLERLHEILESRALEPGGSIILRCPTKARRFLFPRPHQQTRNSPQQQTPGSPDPQPGIPPGARMLTYGESMIFHIVKPSKEER